MPTQWAIDLGTTNSVVARAQDRDVRVVHLPELGRVLPTDQSPLIPSAVHVSDVYKKFLYFFKRKVQEVAIGQRALDRNYDGRSPAYAQSFKRYLGHQSHRTALRCGDREFSVRQVTGMYLKEVIAAIQRQSGEKVTDLTIPAPVGYFEHYRAELQSLAREVGVKRFRSLDEPIAAGLGYGVNVAREENLLVVDFGGGTLNLAVTRLGPQVAETGGAPVMAKHMVNIGGNDVDTWIMEHYVPKELLDLPEWQCDLRWQVMQLKERVSREGFGEMRWRGLTYKMDRPELVQILTKNRMYDQLRTALDDIRYQLEADSGAPARVDEVLIVGGSTQLPEVPAVVDTAFPEAVVRHDPEFVFTSVALGAARFAGGVDVDDFVYHDYAIAVQNEKNHSVEYELLVPRRTRYPTSPDFAVRYYADYPGMTEMRFSVCEVGRLGQAPVGWQVRPNGNRYWGAQTPEERALVVELNPADAGLPLRPSGAGSSPRLRVTYSINEDRWLVMTVEDLVAKRPLREREAVVRLR
jgi:molecular chaperone DnaK (HSP70)